jgi:hypothetical protein
MVVDSAEASDPLESTGDGDREQPRTTGRTRRTVLERNAKI